MVLAGPGLRPEEPLSACRAVSWGEDEAGAQTWERVTLPVALGGSRKDVCGGSWQNPHSLLLAPSKVEARPSGNF